MEWYLTLPAVYRFIETNKQKKWSLCCRSAIIDHINATRETKFPSSQTPQWPFRCTWAGDCGCGGKSPFSSAQFVKEMTNT